MFEYMWSMSLPHGVNRIEHMSGFPNSQTIDSFGLVTICQFRISQLGNAQCLYCLAKKVSISEVWNLRAVLNFPLLLVSYGILACLLSIIDSYCCMPGRTITSASNHTAKIAVYRQSSPTPRSIPIIPHRFLPSLANPGQGILELGQDSTIQYL